MASHTLAHHCEVLSEKHRPLPIKLAKLKTHLPIVCVHVQLPGLQGTDWWETNFLPEAHQDQTKHLSTLTQQLNIKNLFQENNHRCVQR